MRRIAKAAVLLLATSPLVMAATAEYPCRLDRETPTWKQTIRLRSTVNNPGEAASVEVTYPSDFARVEVAVVTDSMGKMTASARDAKDTQLAMGVLATGRPFNFTRDVPGPDRFRIVVASDSVLPTKFDITVTGRKGEILEPKAPAELTIASGEGRVVHTYALHEVTAAEDALALVRVRMEAKGAEVKVAVQSDAREAVQVKLLGGDGKPIGSGQCLGKEPFALTWEPNAPAGASIVVSGAAKGSSIRVTITWRCR